MKLPPVSILCLHGYSMDGALLSRQMKRLTQRLESRARFHFLDAPFVVPSVIDPLQQGCSWWRATRLEEGGWRYDGVDRALDSICEADTAERARSGAGFSGVFGFSQGGALASLMRTLFSRSSAAQ